MDPLSMGVASSSNPWESFLGGPRRVTKKLGTFVMPKVYTGESRILSNNLEELVFSDGRGALPTLPKIPAATKTRRQLWQEEAAREAEDDMEQFGLTHFCYYERTRGSGPIDGGKALPHEAATKGRVARQGAAKKRIVEGGPRALFEAQAVIDALRQNSVDPEIAQYLELQEVRRLREEVESTEAATQRMLRGSIVPISGPSRLVTAFTVPSPLLQQIMEMAEDAEQYLRHPEDYIREGGEEREEGPGIYYLQNIGRRDADGRAVPGDQNQFQWDTWETNHNFLNIVPEGREGERLVRGTRGGVHLPAAPAA